MPNPENLIDHQMKPGQTLNPLGRPKGTRNRSTIARQILSLIGTYPDDIFNKLKQQYPTLEKEMSIEEMMTVVQADKAIRNQDTNAYKAIMDSVYGMPKQELKTTAIADVQVFKIGNQEITFE